MSHARMNRKMTTKSSMGRRQFIVRRAEVSTHPLDVVLKVSPARPVPRTYHYLFLLQKQKQEFDSYVRIRAEAEAPFRSFRIVIFGFGVVSAATANLFAIPQIAAFLGHLENAKSLDTILTDSAINIGALAILSLLLKRDLDAQQKQLARVQREEDLGRLAVQLVNGKRARLTELRGFARPVLVIGTPVHVADAIAKAEPFKERLLQAGVCLVPLPVLGGDNAPLPPAPAVSSRGKADAEAEAEAEEVVDDPRWKVTPLRLPEWKQWVLGQLATVGKTEAEVEGKGLFVGLRLDGRVRSSGTGSPPFERYSYELAAIEGKGAWGGMLDGFDGRVSMFQ